MSEPLFAKVLSFTAVALVIHAVRSAAAGKPARVIWQQILFAAGAAVAIAAVFFAVGMLIN